jgi:hypothetical protein
MPFPVRFDDLVVDGLNLLVAQVNERHPGHPFVGKKLKSVFI